jgi:hypothetical protein
MSPVAESEPDTHALTLFKTGNYLSLGQFDAPIKLGLIWDTNQISDEAKGMAEIGMIGQNIYFAANAITLGR